MATTRRSFAASMTGGALALAPASGQSRAGAVRRAHPLEGIARENLKITDVRVNLLSYELPRGKRWMTGSYLVWKTDSILVASRKSTCAGGWTSAWRSALCWKS